MLRMNSKTDAQLLDERIAQIRKKNEERHKRYLEVEADKQNAAKENALVQLSPPADNWCVERVEAYNDEPRHTGTRDRVGGRPKAGGNEQASFDEGDSRPLKGSEFNGEGKSQGFSRNKAATNNGLEYPGGQQPNRGSKSTRRPEMVRAKPHGLDRAKLTANVSESGAVSYVFPEGEGPPPDPAYNFLADAERDPDRVDRRKRSPKRRDAPRGHPGAARGRPHDGRGGYDGHDHNRSDPQYEAWKAERDRIDQERINRQKTADGQWRREWDKGKVPVEVMDSRPLPRNPRGGRRDAPPPSYRDPDPRTLQDFVRTVEVPGNKSEPVPKRQSIEKHRGPFTGNKSSLYDGPPSVEGSPVVRTVEVSGNRSEPLPKRQSIEKHRGPVAGSKGSLYDGPPSVEGSPGSTPRLFQKERNVKSVGNSILISVPNESTANQSPAFQKVKVNTRTAIGTGRVGPRQKVRLSYSSQSEDEITHHGSQSSRVVRESHPRSPLGPKLAAITSDRLQHDSMFTKPPRPPSGRHSEAPRPRRAKELRPRKKFGARKYSGSTDSKSGSDSASEEKRSEISGDILRKDDFVDYDDDDDDSWEDVATTSGTDSVSAEDSPLKKSLVTNIRSLENKNCPEMLEESVCLDETLAVPVDFNDTQAPEDMQLESPLHTSSTKDTCDESLEPLSKDLPEEFHEGGKLEPSSKDASEEFCEKGSFEPSTKETPQVFREEKNLHPSAQDSSEEFCEKGSFEPSEKHDGPSDESTIPVKEVDNLVNNEEGSDVLSSELSTEKDEKECIEEQSTKKDEKECIEEGMKDKSVVEPIEANKSDSNSKNVEGKELNAVAENSSSEVKQMDSNILSEQNCKVELS